jgi:bifunctional DNA-binding transcriptional regulator/antitoxin component of YhaV-PrlF toxin-antitoxin module
MTITVKDQSRDLIVPPRVRRQAGIKPGDRLEFKASRGVITIVAKPDNAADEYTREQRRLIDARLAQARNGPYYGPFASADKTITFLAQEIKARKAKRSKATSGR